MVESHEQEVENLCYHYTPKALSLVVFVYLTKLSIVAQTSTATDLL